MTRGYRDEDDENDKHEIADCKARGATEKAIRVLGIHDGDPHKGEWIARSMIHDDSEIFEDGHEGRLVIKGWLADKLGMR